MSDSRSEDSFRLLVESVRDYAIFMLDTTGHVLSWNRGAERLTGWRADEIISRHCSVLYSLEDVALEKCEQELELAARDGRCEDEGWRLRKDGKRFWASVVTTALRSPAGELVGFAKVTRELPHAMEDAPRWFETTLRSIGDGVIATDVAANVTLMNPVAERLTGFTIEQARGKRLRDVFRIVDDVTREELDSPAERVLREGIVAALANRTMLRRADGTYVPIADSCAPIRDEAGAVRGVVLVFRDATREAYLAARRVFMMEAAVALASSLDYNETLARLANLAVPTLADWCAVHVVGDDGRPRQVAVAHVDPAKLPIATEVGQSFPWKPDAAAGIPHVIRTGRAELLRRVTDESIAVTSRSPEYLRQLRSLRLRSLVIVPLATGTRVLGTITLMFAESGRSYDDESFAFAEELGRCAGIAVENARLYTAEQRARASADQANRTKDEFLAAVSHELRTPLTAILGWSKMLRAGALDAVQRVHATETIERNAATMTQLIEDLLDVSRIVSGKMLIDVRPVDVGPVIDAALDAVRPAADAKSIVLERSSEREPAIVAGDAARLQQVVWNLVSNAVKFSGRGGRVQVATRSRAGSLEIAVSDHGKGISPAFLPYVFEPFRQAEGGMARSSGGLGLGLAITKHLVELHGGSVDASSEGEGEGATFVVRLPVVPLQSAGDVLVGEVAQPDAPPQLEGLHVLMVDDEEDARQLVQVVLEHGGARVRTATSVDEALAAFQAEVPDVLLSDIGMPGQTGYDLIRRVRALPPRAGGNVPAAALTAYARAEDRSKVLGAGFTRHVPKPIDPAELVAIVSALAGSVRARAT